MKNAIALFAELTWWQSKAVREAIASREAIRVNGRSVGQVEHED